MHLHHLMDKAAEEAAHDRHEFLVGKLLNQICDKTLRVVAATHPDDRTIVIECNFADQVWDDPRIRQRIDALAKQGIDAALQDKTSTVAGETYTRRQLVLTF